MFGILSTVVCFLILTLLTTQAFSSGYITKYTYQEDTQSWKQEPLTMPTLQISLVCAFLCSSDIIAAVSLVKYKEFPKIFSILLGEGLWNDAVAVVLA